MKNQSELFKTNVIYFILIIAFVVIRIISSFDFMPNSSWLDLGFSFVIQLGIMFLIPLFLWKWFNKTSIKNTFSEFRVKKINFVAVLICVGIGICVYILNLGIANIFNAILNAIGYEKSVIYTYTEGSATWGSFLLAILTTAILPGFCEEFAHRGLLLRGFSKLGVKKAILLSGLLFGLMHLNINQFFYAFFIGCILALLVYVSGSIIPSMIVHFMNNFIGIYFSYAEDLNLPFSNVSNWITSISSRGFASIIIVVLIFIAAGVGLVFLMKALFKQTSLRKFEKLKKEIAMQYLKDELLGGDKDFFTDDPESGLVFDEEVEIEGEKKIMRLTIPFDKIGMTTKQFERPTFKDRMFFWGIIILSGLVTFSTFLWGVLG